MTSRCNAVLNRLGRGSVKKTTENGTRLKRASVKCEKISVKALLKALIILVLCVVSVPLVLGFAIELFS